jgi:mannose-1-phosphate guanylyltransferase/mannose-1-phosphate guanylyltransferase/mannose-6-phosphate isomerase
MQQNICNVFPAWAIVTDDAVLVMHRDCSQDVKTLLSQLKKAGHKEATEHRRAYRPWGHYEGLIQGDRFQVKKISVKPGQKLSLQKHFHRAEHWVVVNGTAIVERDAERILLRENESVYLPLGCVHRMENPGMIPLTLIEVQSGSYLGEDDIVRFEDTYGRIHRNVYYNSFVDERELRWRLLTLEFEASFERHLRMA